jgi:DNA helicase-2/ATP-dependent DNA helicase PcrA
LLSSGLTDAQREAVFSDRHPLCVVAGAGSGKTRVLTRRVARRVLDGSAQGTHAMVLTFTRKAANEVRHRLWQLGVPPGVWAGTFHAAAYSQLRRMWADRGQRPPALLSDPARVVRRVLDEGPSQHLRQASSRMSRGAPDEREVVTALCAEIHWAKARLVPVEAYAERSRAAGRTSPPGPERTAEVYALYEAEKRRRGLLDLDDLLDRCTAILEGDEEQARVQRWRVRHLFVDEFQDMNPAQWRLLNAWLAGREDLFVVGDPLQAVYGWNGADPRLLERFGELVPGSTVLHLDENHRSAPSVLRAARSLVVEDRGHRRPTLVSAGRREGPPPLVRDFESEQSEALEVGRWLRRAHRPGRAWSHLAVLARTNARLVPVAVTLKSLGIPFRVSSATARMLSASVTPGSEPKGITAEFLAFLRQAPREQPVRSAFSEAKMSLQLGQQPSMEVLEQSSTTPAAVPSKAFSWSWLRVLLEEHLEEGADSTVGEFLTWLTASSGEEEADWQEDEDRVDLTTFHKAKGLEWRAVAVVGLEDGIVPIAHAASNDALAEERRLLYVALTRAEEELWCSWARERTSRGERWVARPSPFLEPVIAATRDLEKPAASETSLLTLARLRGALEPAR